MEPATEYNVPMLLDRRNFLAGIPALLPAGLAAADASPRTRFYIFQQYLLEQGTQPARIHEFFSQALIPAMDRIHKGPKIFLEAVMTPHLPQVAAIIGIESPDQVWSIAKALSADKEFSRAFDQWESGGAPYVSESSSLLEATGYSPEIVAPERPPAAARIFELRVYHSPTVRQNKALHQRFSGHEIKIFHRVGVNPILYTTTVFGPNRPNLTYLIPFDSLAAREKAWAAFSADEEWIRVRKDSIDRGGQLNTVSNISLYKATPYSPVR
jgi:hypothetical protein